MSGLFRRASQLAPLKLGKPFPSDIRLNAVTMNPVVKTLALDSYGPSTDVSVEQLFAAYPLCSQMQIHYLFPVPQIAHSEQDHIR